MTSTSLNGVNSFVSYASRKQPANQAGIGDGFTAAFNKASGQPNAQETAARSNAVKNATDAGTSKNDVKKAENSSLDIHKKETVESAEKSTGKDTAQNVKTDEKTEDAINKAGEALEETVAEELGVSLEEVQKAMEMLGLTAASLLMPGNMTQLVLAIQETDLLSLVTDGEMYQTVQNLVGAVEETIAGLARQLDAAPQDMEAILKQAVQETNQAVNNETIPNETEAGISGSEGTKETLQEIPDEIAVDAETVETAAEATTEEDESSLTRKAKETAADGETGDNVENPKKETGKEGTSGKNNSSQGNSAQNNSLLDNLAGMKENALKADVVFEKVIQAGAQTDTGNIMKQIMDYMKIQVKADLTQMEIQLHPASLGTVNVNITSKEGVITAQFLAQNESVKAVIESQVAQLKTNFEEQGLKVEAVEVAVESHQFDRNLGRDSQEQNRQGSGKKKGIRKLNLNGQDMADAELNEEEQIAVEMMTADGSTVDYTA